MISLTMQGTTAALSFALCGFAGAEQTLQIKTRPLRDAASAKQMLVEVFETRGKKHRPFRSVGAVLVDGDSAEPVTLRLGARMATPDTLAMRELLRLARERAAELLRDQPDSQEAKQACEAVACGCAALAFAGVAS